MQYIIEILGLHIPNVRWVMLAMILLSMNSAVIGTFAVLRQRALLGDAIAHAILPGICVGFLLSGEKNSVFLLTGAVISGWLSLQAIQYILKNTPIKSDGAIAREQLQRRVHKGGIANKQLQTSNCKQVIVNEQS
jgi:manganese/zinc/iron transport system permease protein